jgi:hypothetical protein
VAGLDPEPADRAADMAGADNADALLCLRRRAQRAERRTEDERAASDNDGAALRIDRVSIESFSAHRSLLPLVRRI